jgi:hypothetical protein
MGGFFQQRPNHKPVGEMLRFRLPGSGKYSSFFLQAKVWRLIFNWMGSKVQVCDNVSPHFMAFGDLCKGKNS